MTSILKDNKTIILCFCLYIINISLFSVTYYSIYKNDINEKVPKRNFLFNNDLIKGKVFEDSTIIFSSIVQNKNLIDNSIKARNIIQIYLDTISQKNDLINFTFQRKVGLPFKVHPISGVYDEANIHESKISLSVSYRVGRNGYTNRKEIVFDLLDDKTRIFLPEFFVDKMFNFDLEELISRQFEFSTKSKENLSLFKYICDYYLKELHNFENQKRKELTFLEHDYEKILDGKPNSQWNFTDFYYFSTTSLVLNTYGDILPNSTKIRRLLTFESFINLFILLLFFNLKLNQK